MKKEAIEILKKHGCLYMKDDYKKLFKDLEEMYLSINMPSEYCGTCGKKLDKGTCWNGGCKNNGFPF